MNGSEPRMAPWLVRLGAGLSLLLLGGMGSPAAAQDGFTIDTRINNQGAVCCVSSSPTEPGAPNGGAYVSYGQVFQMPSSGLLTDFSFWLGRNSGVATFQAYIVAWDSESNRMVGDTPLWSSGEVQGPTTLPHTQTLFDVGGPGVELYSGMFYMALLSTVTPSGTVAQAVPNAGNYGSNNFQMRSNGFVGPSNVYRFVQYPQFDQPWSYGSQWAAMQQRSWDTFGTKDLHLLANFDAMPTSTVPEPMSILLFGSGLLGLRAAVRRRRKEGSGTPL